MSDAAGDLFDLYYSDPTPLDQPFMFGTIFIDGIATLDGAQLAAKFLNQVENTDCYVAGIGVNQYYVIKKG